MSRCDGRLKAGTRNLNLQEAGRREQSIAVVNAMQRTRSKLDSTLLMHEFELHMHAV